MRRVAIQTNLSCRTALTADADRDALALWCTYHPVQVPYERFLARCRELADGGVRFSVGVVGVPEHLPHARRLDGARPPLSVQPQPAPQPRTALPHRRVGRQGMDEIRSLSSGDNYGECEVREAAGGNGREYHDHPSGQAAAGMKEGV
ncbi:hypothetical protein GCM10009802_15160 [Streptomyces synnematoformans]|uniref:Uncharacterized protein n=1 Tax=Streptomyces synnematoformans TaxID=415721 RepID=A0ABN2XP18_9ACTN